MKIRIANWQKQQIYINKIGEIVKIYTNLLSDFGDMVYIYDIQNYTNGIFLQVF